jgi:hypothetical protein
MNAAFFCAKGRRFSIAVVYCWVLDESLSAFDGSASVVDGNVFLFLVADKWETNVDDL